MKIINLTPHAINIFDGDKMVNKVEPSGLIARVKENKKQFDIIEIESLKIPLNEKEFGDISVEKDGKSFPFPKKEEGVIYIVSALVAQALPDRDDIFIPDDVVRDDSGRIIGCRALARI